VALGTKIRRRRQKSKKDGKEGKLKRENEKGVGGREKETNK